MALCKEARSPRSPDPGGGGEREAIAFRPNGKWVVTGAGLPFTTQSPRAEPSIRVWDVASGTLRRTLHGMAAKITGLAVSSDGTKIATCGGPRLSSGTRRAAVLWTQVRARRAG